MNKVEFLGELESRLSGLPQNDIEERVAFYREMIDERIESGETEEAAVAGIGTVDSVVAQMMSEIPLSKLVKDNVAPNRRIKTWEIVLIVLGVPLWVPLVFAFIIIIFSLYIVIWSLVFSIYVIDLCFVIVTFAALIAAIPILLTGYPQLALFSVGASFICAALTIIMFFVSILITKSVIKMTGGIRMGIKNTFVGKEK